MKLKSAALSLALAVIAAPALAGPVSIESGDLKKGKFAHHFAFDLDHAQDFFGEFRTHSKQSNDVIVQSASLTNGVDTFALLMSVEHEWVDGRQVTYQLWTLPQTALAAGNWTLNVSGQDTNSKAVGSYSGRLQAAANAVPEPQSLALAGLALSAAFFAARRRSAR